MFIPAMAGVLAATVLVVAAILAATKASRAARVLAFAGLGLVIVAVGLAVSAELLYRDCRSENERRWDAYYDEYPAAEVTGAPPGVVDTERCERWPW